MKVKFERHYGEYKIGDFGDFEKGEELNYILKTGTAIIIEEDTPKLEEIEENKNDDFGNSEIENNRSEETEEMEENLEEVNEIGKGGKNKKK